MTHILDGSSIDWYTEYWLLSTSCSEGGLLLLKTTLCGHEYEVLEHLFWECVKTHYFWADFVTWLHTNVLLCSSLRLSKEVIITGFETCVFWQYSRSLYITCPIYFLIQDKHVPKDTERHWDVNLILCCAVPHIQVCIGIVKQRSDVEKMTLYTNNRSTHFPSDWFMYSHYFS